jgi:ATP-dependent exoDNAse (exonuclease V) alpha subunit
VPLLAIYHFSIEIITRGIGKSAVAAAAYRAGETITNERDGLVHDYSRKGGVVHTEILLPTHAPAEYSDRAVFWNAVEKVERYKNSQLARGIEFSLPVELTIEQNISLARRFVSEVFVKAGMCADVCVHDTDGSNPHAHIMLTMRPIDENGKWMQKSHTVNGRKIPTVDWNEHDRAEDWRKAWAAYANGALRLAGKLTEDNVLDHRSYERQGIDKEPTIHLGPAAHQMEKRGIRTDRGDINRAIVIGNKQLAQLNARIKKVQKWLDGEKGHTQPTLTEVICDILSGDPGRSHSQQIRDLQLGAKTLVFIQNNNLHTIEDLRGYVGNLYFERQELADRMKPVNRRIETLDKHLMHSENLKKHDKLAKRRDELYAEYKRLDGKGFLFKLQADKALKAAEAYDWKHLNALKDYDDADKYLRKILQKRFDPKDIPVKAWQKERDTLAIEKGGLDSEYNVMKERTRDVEVIRKYAENVSHAINHPQKSRGIGMEL